MTTPTAPLTYCAECQAELPPPPSRHVTFTIQGRVYHLCNLECASKFQGRLNELARQR